ncbi:hypothetical protein ACUH96_00735 [Dermabacteraceae bacterium P13077]
MDIHKVHAWVRETTGRATDASVARKSGLNQTTYSRQVRTSSYKPSTIVAIARAYNANVLEGLITLGLINGDDIEEVRVLVDLHNVTDEELLDEVARRITSGRAGATLASGDSVNVSDPASNVTPINRATREELYEGINEEELLNLPYAAATPKDTGEDGDSV